MSDSFKWSTFSLGITGNEASFAYTSPYLAELIKTTKAGITSKPKWNILKRELLAAVQNYIGKDSLLCLEDEDEDEDEEPTQEIAVVESDVYDASTQEITQLSTPSAKRTKTMTFQPARYPVTNEPEEAPEDCSQEVFDAAKWEKENEVFYVDKYAKEKAALKRRLASKPIVSIDLTDET